MARLAELATDGLANWWNDAEHSVAVQEGANYGLGAAYCLIGLIAVVQLVRIQLRVPEYGWTTQKVFHLLNFIVCAVRGSTFLLRDQLEKVHPAAVRVVLFDLPGLLFFTTYTLLVLFWAEIYFQARSIPTTSLRPLFAAVNVVIYLVMGGLWAFYSTSTTPGAQAAAFVLSAAFLALVSLCAALGFLLYGGRLFIMLQRFPIESRGRRKKLREVGMVTSICTACFALRAALAAASAIDRTDLELDVLDHPLLNILYYCCVEVLPAACVLYILRKLPPKKQQQQQGYQQIPSQ